MAYTGTGTEQDPYLVSNLDDFITCVGITGAYVKVIADIDTREETEYPTYRKITFAALKVYADTLTKVSGFIVADDYCFYKNGSGNATAIQNIHFTDILYKPVGNATVIYQSSSNSYDFIGCIVSIETSYDSQHINGVQGANFHQCGVYLGFDGSNFSTTLSDILFDSNVNFYGCIVEVEGFPAAYLNGDWVYYSEYTVFKISLKKYLDNSNNINIFFDTSSHDNVIIISQKLASGARLYIPFTIRGTSTVADSEASENTTISFANTGGRNHLLTTEQIQSESYLREIGFIP